jgi:hypothetical protein
MDLGDVVIDAADDLPQAGARVEARREALEMAV